MVELYSVYRLSVKCTDCLTFRFLGLLALPLLEQLQSNADLVCVGVGFGFRVRQRVADRELIYNVYCWYI